MNQNDVSLVLEAQRGNRSAFEELVRRTSRLVYARLYLETGNAHLAEDLTQETFLQAVRKLKTLQQARQFRAWLLRIADNAAIDAARSRMRQKRAEPPRAPSETLQQVAGNGPNPADIASDREEH